MPLRCLLPPMLPLRFAGRYIHIDAATAAVAAITLSLRYYACYVTPCFSLIIAITLILAPCHAATY